MNPKVETAAGLVVLSMVAVGIYSIGDSLTDQHLPIKRDWTSIASPPTPRLPSTILQRPIETVGILIDKFTFGLSRGAFRDIGEIVGGFVGAVAGGITGGLATGGEMYHGVFGHTHGCRSYSSAEQTNNFASLATANRDAQGFPAPYRQNVAVNFKPMAPTA